MAALAPDELVCDMAETYHVLDWRALPLRLAATLAAGLPETSRSLRKAAGRTVDFETELLAYAADRLTRCSGGCTTTRPSRPPCWPTCAARRTPATCSATPAQKNLTPPLRP